MKKHVILLFASVLAATSLLQGQDYPAGVYMSLEEIKSKTPSRQIELSVIRRTDGDIKMNGGNDYKLETEDPAIKNSFLKKEMWAYSQGDTLYLNGRQIQAQPWYTAVLADGRYMVFKAGISNRSDVMKKQQRNANTMGVMFGAIGGGISAARMAMMRFLYVIDQETDNVIAIDTDTLKTLLQPNEELLAAFDNELHRDTEEIQIKYLELLNESLR